MKLRIRGDSIRLRLTRGEVRALLEAGTVADATRFPAGPALSYELRAVADAPAVTAGFESTLLRVTLPKAAADAWGRSEQVAIEASVAVPGGMLSLLVEKDFPCLTDRPGEDDSDAFRRDRLQVEG